MSTTKNRKFAEALGKLSGILLFVGLMLVVKAAFVMLAVNLLLSPWTGARITFLGSVGIVLVVGMLENLFVGYKFR
jgi:hypothetical protein